MGGNGLIFLRVILLGQFFFLFLGSISSVQSPDFVFLVTGELNGRAKPCG